MRRLGQGTTAGGPVVGALLAALVLVEAPPDVRANTLWIPSVVHECAIAADDTVRIDLLLDDTAGPISGGSFQVSYDAALLTFVSAQRGALIATWADFQSAGLGSAVEITASGASAISAQSTGTFARLLFVTGCCGGAFIDHIALCIGALSGDFAGLAVQCGTFRCIAGQPGSVTVATLFQSCSGSPDTVEVAVRLEDTPGPVDAGGVDVAFDPARMAYVGYVRGDLTAGWQLFDAAHLGNVIRAGGFDLVPIPPGSTGTFVTLRFVIDCCSGFSPNVPLCPQAAVDDLAPFSTFCGSVTCMSVAARPATWGYVKSLYR
jgi:hypothetical protein